MIKLFEQYKEYDLVKSWLDTMGIKNYTINDDLTVDVDGAVNLYQAYIKNIPIQFGKVSGHFDCGSNYDFTSLKGCPQEVGGFFNCSGNRLTSLEGGPEQVRSFYNCINNDLTSLKYAPKYLSKDFLCQNNPLPIELIDFIKINSDGDRNRTKMIIDNQEEYGIWNADGSFNEGRWKIFRNDFIAATIKKRET